MNVAQRWRLKMERAAWRLDQPQALRLALWLVPVFFGLLSWSMRQDSNWDLRNYHLYNPFAWLNGKVGLDVAPAQMQTYFNPTIDLLYYGLNKIAPPWIIGFVMGVIHGLNFVILVALARTVLPPGPHGPSIRLPLMLAFAGMFSAGFIAQLGNTMGDNLAALFVLGAVTLVLRHWHAFARAEGLGQLLLAGFVMGLGVGLKLTNGIYAPALCLALLLVPASGTLRIRAAFLFGVGVLAGIAVTAGHWFWKMWALFGNPLYPQFNTLFHSPLAGPIGVGDLRWMPQGLLEKALWPFIFAMHPERISEIKLSMVVWPILYVALVVLACVSLARCRAVVVAADGVESSRNTALLTFFALSYFTWLNLFSIHRYLVPLELLAPVVLWLVAQRLLPHALAGKVAAVLVLMVLVCSVPSKNWGRTGFAKQTLSAEVPVLADPSQSMVLTIHADPPMAWIATFYSPDLAFVSLVSGIESPALTKRIEDMRAARKGPVYLMLSDSGAGVEAGMDGARKQEGLAADAARDREADRILAERGLQFASSACVNYPAHIGNHLTHYRLCPVTPLAEAAPIQP